MDHILDLEKLFLGLGYTFRDADVVTTALTHTSYANENPRAAPHHNERLEFLGDAVLDFVISDALMREFPDSPEGDLSKIRASLVSEGALAELARELDLGAHLRIGRGERRSGGHEKNSILSDALEALLAAVYLDSAPSSGISEVQRVILALFKSRLGAARKEPGNEDYKTALQELVQSHHRETVRYDILAEKGPDHDKHFHAAVFLRDRELGRGDGRSKKTAEQAAARTALENTEWMKEGEM